MQDHSAKVLSMLFKVSFDSYSAHCAMCVLKILMINCRAESVKVVADNQWNSMHLKDFWNPKVFLCKAGRFFEHLHSNHLDPDYPETFDREEFGTENFKHR